jgi:hypothetical protein
MNKRIAFDIGGVLSKYPEEFEAVAWSLFCSGFDVFVITDQPLREEVVKQLFDNGFGFILPENIYCADYATHGEMCKAVLMRDLGITFLVDDFAGYLAWDSSFGPAPIRLRVEPDAFRPYWHPSWKCEGGDFGRSCFNHEAEGEVKKNG